MTIELMVAYALLASRSETFNNPLRSQKQIDLTTCLRKCDTILPIIKTNDRFKAMAMRLLWVNDLIDEFPFNNPTSFTLFTKEGNDLAFRFLIRTEEFDATTVMGSTGSEYCCKDEYHNLALALTNYYLDQMPNNSTDLQLRTRALRGTESIIGRVREKSAVFGEPLAYARLLQAIMVTDRSERISKLKKVARLYGARFKHIGYRAQVLIVRLALQRKDYLLAKACWNELNQRFHEFKEWHGFAMLYSEFERNK